MRGELRAARERLLSCGQPQCPGPIANDCAGWLVEVDNSLSSVVFAVSDERGGDLTDVRVWANGELLTDQTDGRALVLDPGTYTFRFEAAGHHRSEQHVAIRQSEKNRIVRVSLASDTPPDVLNSREQSATPALAAVHGARAAPSSATSATERADRAASSRAIPVATYVLGGTALLGIGTFAYFGLTGLHHKDQLDRCETSCDALRRSGKREYVIADVALGVAIGSATAAIVVYLVHRSKAPRRAEPASLPLTWTLAF